MPRPSLGLDPLSKNTNTGFACHTLLPRAWGQCDTQEHVFRAPETWPAVGHEAMMRRDNEALWEGVRESMQPGDSSHILCTMPKQRVLLPSQHSSGLCEELRVGRGLAPL